MENSVKELYKLNPDISITEFVALLTHISLTFEISLLDILSNNIHL